MLLPKPNNLPKSLASLTKMFDRKQAYEENYVCQDCKSLLCKENKSIENKCVFCSSQKINKFIIFDICTQLSDILSKSECIKQIKCANNHSKVSNLQSPLDAVIYQSYLEDKITSNKEPHDITVSFNLNSDGAPVTSSRSYSMWPVLGTILELKPSCREKIENLIIFGICLSQSKPIETYLRGESQGAGGARI
jgi:hypothetical protein